MSNIICHHNGRYNFYTTIADGFCYVSSLSVKQVQEVIKEKYGQDRLNKLPDRLERAHKNGHSGISDETLQEILCCNRAGDNEEHLTYDECIRRYLS